MAHDKASLLDVKAKAVQAEQGNSAGQRNCCPRAPWRETNYDLDEANCLVTEPDVEVGKARILVSEAALSLAKTNLAYCFIHAPCKGVIISRRVNIGQTVVGAMAQ